MDNILRYTLRINRILFKKFRYIANSEGRSANREIEQYIKQRVKELEAANGKILNLKAKTIKNGSQDLRLSRRLE